MWVCPQCRQRVSVADGPVCPSCGYSTTQTSIGPYIVREDGLTSIATGGRRSGPLFRICRHGGVCGISFWDKTLNRERFVRLDDLAGLVKEVCKPT